LFVFPRDSVWIQHDGGEPFVADMNTVTYYNAGQHYRRRPLSAWGDRCEWFAFTPEIVGEALAVYEPAAADRLDRPFVFSHGPADADSYLQQRLVFTHVTHEYDPDCLYVEETMLSVLGRVSAHAYQRRGSCHRVPARRRTGRDVVEHARDFIARQFHRDLSLAHVAEAVGTSVFHLSRVFHARTGFSLHQYRNQLRLRTALEVLAGRTVDLSRLALDLGFSSHSHFTETFRRTFGCTPSSFRRDGTWREPQG
jgi:AraC-like DNA-binding protein